MIYRTKDLKQITLGRSKHPKLEGMCRMVFITVGDKWTQALGGKAIHNPWLPEDEAIANLKAHAERLGWKEITK